MVGKFVTTTETTVILIAKKKLKEENIKYPLHCSDLGASLWQYFSVVL